MATGKRLRQLEALEFLPCIVVTFATLPVPGIITRLAYVTDGRKAAEGPGAGQGVLCYDGLNAGGVAAWIAVDSGVPVTA